VAVYDLDDITHTTNMQALKWIVLALALFQGGWLTFDGGRALLAGDYVTPASGPRAGQLGQWARVVSAVGFEPRSTFIKCFHLFLGIAWLVATFVFMVRPAAGWWVVLCCGVATLWYLPVGTMVSIVVIGLLLTSPLRTLL
jgi:hypothetical protein